MDEEGCNYDKRLINLFKLRNIENDEIKFLGPIVKDGFFFYLLPDAECLNFDEESKILDDFCADNFRKLRS